MPARFTRCCWRVVFAVAGLAGLATDAPAQIPGDKIKIGVLSDFSGPFADQVGKGSLVGAQLAAEDFAKEAGGLKVEIISADHQNKPDIGVAIARRWVDEEGVDAIVDLANSGVGLAVNTLMHEKNRAMLASATATSDLTGKFCQPTTVQWALDTWALGSAVGRTITKMGGSTWYFISFEYALGKALQRDATEAIVKAGGSVVGSVSHPLGATDFGSYLLQAQASGAKVIALADTGADAINAIRQAAEFQIVGPDSAARGAVPADHRYRRARTRRRRRASSCPKRSIGISTIRRAPSARASPNAWAARCRPKTRPRPIRRRWRICAPSRRRERSRATRSGRNEEVADRRSALRPCRRAHRRTSDARDVRVQGQVAAAIEEPV